VSGVSDQSRAIEEAFTAQAASFNSSAVANAPDVLDALLTAAAPRREERWLEAACGPGVVSRAFAPSVRAVHGVDLTPAMIELARRQAVAAGADNATFEVADATATGLPDASFDGAVTRFSLHHLPLPARLLQELARLVRPGGRIVVADHLADDDGEARAWTQEVERLRDPSHWASLSRGQLREIGDAFGLVLEAEETHDLSLDLDDWLVRGGGDAASRAIAERALASRPAGTECFAVCGDGGRRTLGLRMWVGVWRRA
jgi:SAM-dependent methyltransferase